MTPAPHYPIKTWECNVCGRENPGDIGFCPTCSGGALVREGPRPSGGLEHGAVPYFPAWHAREAGFDEENWHLPCKEKYPHHRRRRWA